MKHIIAGISVAILAIACGGDDSSTGGDATPTTTETTATATAESVESTATATTQPATAQPTATATAVEPTSTQPAPSATPTASPFEGGTDPITKQPEAGDTVIAVDVRVGQHDGFDRIVFEFAGEEMPGYQIGYVNSASACGSGEPVTLPGAAMLSVQFSPAAGHNGSGEATIGVIQVNLGGPAITLAEQVCDFEAILAWVVGVTDEQPFKVMELSDPTRLVIDIATP